MSLLVALLCILFLGAALILVIVNHAVVDVDLLYRSFEKVPVAVVMVTSLLAGIIFASFISIIDGIRIRVQNRRLRKRVLRLEDELEAQRRPPREQPSETNPEETPPPDYASR